ncbi:MAG: gcvT [Paenibacillus sp.]|nr:gcvT [Paenibacillus sp.]
MAGLKQTPLYPLYAKYGGKTIDFGGWDLPVQFTGIQNEHDAVRLRAGLFDVSHMGEFIVTGTGVTAFLQRMTTNDVTKLETNQAQYSLLCYPDGGVVDDLLIYKLAEDRYMLVVNASNIDKDFEWLESHLDSSEDVSLVNISDQTSLIALQGPASLAIIGKLTDAPLEELRSYRFIPEIQVAGVEALVSRTGYTGEDGFELYVDAEDASTVWEKLLEAGADEGIVAAGLGARDTLRFEARLPLYGQELSDTITPLEAGVGFFVKLDKGDFIGREALVALKEQGLPRKLVGIEMIDRGIPRSHYPVFSAEGQQIGEVTTGTQSPTLKRNIGMALLNKEYTALDSEIYVEIRGKRLKAVVVKTPFYKRVQN